MATADSVPRYLEKAAFNVLRVALSASQDSLYLTPTASIARPCTTLIALTAIDSTAKLAGTILCIITSHTNVNAIFLIALLLMEFASLVGCFSLAASPAILPPVWLVCLPMISTIAPALVPSAPFQMESHASLAPRRIHFASNATLNPACSVLLSFF